MPSSTERHYGLWVVAVSLMFLMRGGSLSVLVVMSSGGSALGTMCWPFGSEATPQTWPRPGDDVSKLSLTLTPPSLNACLYLSSWHLWKQSQEQKRRAEEFSYSVSVKVIRCSDKPTYYSCIHSPPCAFFQHNEVGTIRTQQLFLSAYL